MKKQFELNGVNVELSKEQLQEMLKDFDEPVWRIEKYGSCDIVLYKDKELSCWLWDKNSLYQENISLLIIRIAEAMGYLATEAQIRNSNKIAYYVTFDDTLSINFGVDYAYDGFRDKIIDTREHAEKIVELIKSSKDLLDYIWMDK